MTQKEFYKLLQFYFLLSISRLICKGHKNNSVNLTTQLATCELIFFISPITIPIIRTVIITNCNILSGESFFLHGLIVLWIFWHYIRWGKNSDIFFTFHSCQKILSSIFQIITKTNYYYRINGATKFYGKKGDTDFVSPILAFLWNTEEVYVHRLTPKEVKLICWTKAITEKPKILQETLTLRPEKRVMALTQKLLLQKEVCVCAHHCKTDFKRLV